METKEWKWPVEEKAAFANGEWTQEPDKMQWKDEETGYPCLIVRNPMGALCGYVGVDVTHPYFEKEYDDCDVSVHGGLTFSDKCHDVGSPERGICHVDPTDGPRWWFGFDCAHLGDFSPCYTSRMYASIRANSLFEGEYRNIEYVKKEVRSLALQLQHKKK